MLIGLCANGRQAGKDTIAKIMQEWCQTNGFSFQRLAFADPMKHLVAMTLGILPSDGGSFNSDQFTPDRLADVDHFKLHGSIDWYMDDREPGPGVTDVLSGVDFIINLAEGARRLFGLEFWTDVTLPRDWTPAADFTVITDVRFPKECNRITEHRGMVIKVQRPGATDGRSEGEVDDVYVDYVLDNDAGLDELRHTVHQLMIGFGAAKRT